MLTELTAAAGAAPYIAFDFLIPNKLLRDPFQMSAATVAAMPKGNKFIQSVAFAIGSNVWIVSFREEFLGALAQVLGSATRKVRHFYLESNGIQAGLAFDNSLTASCLCGLGH